MLDKGKKELSMDELDNVSGGYNQIPHDDFIEGTCSICNKVKKIDPRLGICSECNRKSITI